MAGATQQPSHLHSVTLPLNSPTPSRGLPCLPSGEIQLADFQPAPPPLKFEAGTPAIAEAIGFGAAIDYLNRLGMKEVHE